MCRNMRQGSRCRSLRHPRRYSRHDIERSRRTPPNSRGIYRLFIGWTPRRGGRGADSILQLHRQLGPWRIHRLDITYLHFVGVTVSKESVAGVQTALERLFGDVLELRSPYFRGAMNRHTRRHDEPPCDGMRLTRRSVWRACFLRAMYGQSSTGAVCRAAGARVECVHDRDDQEKGNGSPV
jgi:hypothetical protein